MRQIGRLVGLVCAFAVAVVSTFHVCDAATGRAVDIAVGVSDVGDGGTLPDFVVIEKCHMCAVVSLPAMLASDSSVQLIRTIPPGSTLHVTPFSQPAVGPPPKA